MKNGFLTVPAYVLVVICSLLWRGYILVLLWGWFSVPFFGLPELTIPVAIGMVLIVALLIGNVTKVDADDVTEELGIIFLRPGIFLILGYSVHLFL